MNFSETIVACDLKVGRCRQLTEFIKVCEHSRSRSFLDLGPRSLKVKVIYIWKFKTCFSQKPLDHFNQILYVSFWLHGNEIYYHEAG